MLEKTLESPLDCKEIQPVHPKGDQSWVFIGRTDIEAETPILVKRPGDSMPSWGQIQQLVKGNPWFQKKAVCHCISNVISRVQGSIPPNSFPTYSVTSEISYKRDHSIRRLKIHWNAHITWWRWVWLEHLVNRAWTLVVVWRGELVQQVPPNCPASACLFSCSFLSQQRGWFRKEWPRARLIFTHISGDVLWETQAITYLILPGHDLALDLTDRFWHRY